jgi:limonene 1,2-monooxygenase
LIETGTACIGTPDDAIAYIEKLLQGSGGFGVIMELAHNWADFEATRKHYELMARYVHGHFQKSFAPRVDAYAHSAAHFKEFTKQAAEAVNTEIEKQAARQAKTGT